MALTDPSPPLVNRELLAADLERLSAVVDRVLTGRLPKALLRSVRAFGVDPTRMTWQTLSRVSDLDDRELAVLIEALAIELGAIRGVREPLRDPSPELTAALVRLGDVLGA